MNSNSLLAALLLVLVLAIVQVMMVARTASSKGRSGKAWGVYTLVSPVIATGFALFLRPRSTTSPQSPEPLSSGTGFLGAAGTARAYRTKPLSILAYIGGIAVQLWAFNTLPITDTMSDQQIVDALSGSAGVGAILLIGAGMLLMIAAVANEKFSVGEPSVQ